MTWTSDRAVAVSVLTRNPSECEAVLQGQDPVIHRRSGVSFAFNVSVQVRCTDGSVVSQTRYDDECVIVPYSYTRTNQEDSCSSRPDHLMWETAICQCLDSLLEDVRNLRDEQEFISY